MRLQIYWICIRHPAIILSILETILMFSTYYRVTTGKKWFNLTILEADNPTLPLTENSFLLAVPVAEARRIASFNPKIQPQLALLFLAIVLELVVGLALLFYAD